MKHISDDITMDGCEYYKIYIYGSNYAISHKGNCNNPIHIYK